MKWLVFFLLVGLLLCLSCTPKISPTSNANLTGEGIREAWKVAEAWLGFSYVDFGGGRSGGGGAGDKF